MDNIWQPGISTCALRPCGDWQDTAFKPSVHIPMIKKAGFETIELCCYMGDLGTRDFDWKNVENVDELAKIALDYGISVSSVHTPELRLCIQDKAGSEKVDILKRFIKISMELNSKLMVIHYFPDKDNDSKTDQHLSIGKGVTDWSRFAKSLIETGYEGSLILESDERPPVNELYSFLENSRKSLDGFQY